METVKLRLSYRSHSSQRKIMRSLISILLIVLLAPTLFSQDLISPQMDGLFDKDVFDGFATGDAVYVYRAVKLPANEKAVKDLTKMLPVDRAALHGVPGKLQDELTDAMLGMETTTSLQSVSAESYGDLGFLWKVVYDIRPAQGGATGVWPSFIRYVKPDGSLINPETYICSRKLVAEDTPLFSVMSFDDLSIDSDSPQIDGEEALRIARESIEKICAAALVENLKIKTRFHDQGIVKIPIKGKKPNETILRPMWQVRFMLADHASYELFDCDPIIVWITSDGFASTLSLNEWHAKNRRTKK